MRKKVTDAKGDIEEEKNRKLKKKKKERDREKWLIKKNTTIEKKEEKNFHETALHKKIFLQK